MAKYPTCLPPGLDIHGKSAGRAEPAGVRIITRSLKNSRRAGENYSIIASYEVFRPGSRRIKKQIELGTLTGKSILMSMSKRLQVVISSDELKALRHAALREGLTLSEWARRVLRRAQQAQAGPTPDQKLRALDQALRCGHPTGDIDQMLSEVERGRDLR